METKEKIAPETMLLHACTLLITKSLLDIIDIVEAKEQNSGRTEEKERKEDHFEESIGRSRHYSFDFRQFDNIHN